VLIDAEKYYVRIGDFANILIESASEFDLIGKPV
jgi:ribosomal protein S12 methylthiotransferase